MIMEEAIELIREHAAEHEDGALDAKVAQFDPLFGDGDTEIVNAKAHEVLGDDLRAMSVGVRLDDGKNFHSGSDAGADGVEIMLEGRDVDIGAGGADVIEHCSYVRG